MRKGCCTQTITHSAGLNPLFYNQALVLGTWSILGALNLLLIRKFWGQPACPGHRYGQGGERGPCRGAGGEVLPVQATGPAGVGSRRQPVVVSWYQKPPPKPFVWEVG